MAFYGSELGGHFASGCRDGGGVGSGRAHVVQRRGEVWKK
jgi:hypothetical protein